MNVKTSHRTLILIWAAFFSFLASSWMLMPKAEQPSQAATEPAADAVMAHTPEASTPDPTLPEQETLLLLGEDEDPLTLFADGLSRFREDDDAQSSDPASHEEFQLTDLSEAELEALMQVAPLSQEEGLEAARALEEANRQQGQPEFEAAYHELYVDAERLNMRSGPSTDDPVIEQIEFGTKVLCIGESDEWVRVRHEDRLGFLSREYTSPDMVFRDVDETRYVDAGSLNLRAEPSTKADVLRKLSQNTRLTRTGTGLDWSRVQTADGVEGYVANEFLTERIYVTLGSTIDSGRAYGPIEQADFDLFKRIVALESRPQFGYDGYLAVASVILNRVQSSRYPNTVRGVVSQRGQFSVYTSSRTPHYNDAVDRAVRDALAGKRNLPDYVLFFANPDGYSRNVARGGVFARLSVHAFDYNHYWAYYESDR